MATAEKPSRQQGGGNGHPRRRRSVARRPAAHGPRRRHRRGPLRPDTVWCPLARRLLPGFAFKARTVRCRATRAHRLRPAQQSEDMAPTSHAVRRLIITAITVAYVIMLIVLLFSPKQSEVGDVRVEVLCVGRWRRQTRPRPTWLTRPPPPPPAVRGADDRPENGKYGHSHGCARADCRRLDRRCVHQLPRHVDHGKSHLTPLRGFGPCP